MASERRSKAECGFTLVELLVVLVIISLVTAIVAPDFAATLRGEPTAVERLAGIMRSARSAALRLGKTVCFDANAGGTFRITARAAGTDSLLVVGTLREVIAMRPRRDDERGTVCFYPSGVATEGARWSLAGNEVGTVEVDPWDGTVSIVR